MMLCNYTYLYFDYTDKKCTNKVQYKVQESRNVNNQSKIKNDLYIGSTLSLATNCRNFVFASVAH